MIRMVEVSVDVGGMDAIGVGCEARRRTEFRSRKKISRICESDRNAIRIPKCFFGSFYNLIVFSSARSF